MNIIHLKWLNWFLWMYLKYPLCRPVTVMWLPWWCILCGWIVYHRDGIMQSVFWVYPSKHECNTSTYCGSRCAPCWRLVWLSDSNLLSQTADFRKWVEEADYLVTYRCPMPSWLVLLILSFVFLFHNRSKVRNIKHSGKSGTGLHKLWTVLLSWAYRGSCAPKCVSWNF